MTQGHEFSDFFYEQFEDKKFAFLSPYYREFGSKHADLVNGITGVPLTFKKDGADFYYFHSLKDLDDLKLKSTVSQYDYFIYPVYPEYFKLLERIRPMFDGTIIGVTDIQTHVISNWSMEDLKLFTSSLKLYDYIMCTNMDEVSTFRVALDDEQFKKCAYTGWSMYPEELHYPHFKINRDKLLISVGINNPGDFNRDILTNMAVYKGLKKRFPQVSGFMYYMTPNKKEQTKELLDYLGVEDFELVDELPYDQALEYLSNAYMAIHMYTFKVVGRLTQDCAALGIPMVGTIANLPNRLCFPDTSTNDYYVEEAIDIASRLITDKFFYQQVVEKAMTKALFYNTENTQKRIWALLKGVNA
jgi:hypothetical protein